MALLTMLLVVLFAAAVIVENVWRVSRKRACRLRGHRWKTPPPVSLAWRCRRCGYVIDYAVAGGWE